VFFVIEILSAVSSRAFLVVSVKSRLQSVELAGGFHSLVRSETSSRCWRTTPSSTLL